MGSFRIGYAGRRASHAGPAPELKGRREPSPSGFAENGSPPARRGETAGNGPACHLLRPERARRTSLCGTHGGRSGWFRRTFTSVDPGSEPAAKAVRIRPPQRNPSREQKPPNGALRGVTYTLTYEAAFSAPSDPPASRRMTKRNAEDHQGMNPSAQRALTSRSPAERGNRGSMFPFCSSVDS